MTILAASLVWKEGATAKGWKLFWRSFFSLWGMELLVLVGVFIYLAWYGNGFDRNALTLSVDFFYMLGIFSLPAFFLLHGLPVILLMCCFRMLGFGMKNAFTANLPQVPWRWQFRIRDLIVLTFVVSCLMAPLPLVDSEHLLFLLGLYVTREALLIAIGSFLVVLFLTLMLILQRKVRRWPLWIVIAVLVIFAISILQTSRFSSRALPQTLSLAINTVHFVTLLLAWICLANKGWRIVREGDL